MMISENCSFIFSWAVSNVIRQIYYLYCSMYMILPCLYVASTKKMGLGVFTKEAIKAGTIVEVSPVLVMKQIERELLDQTLLHDYIFEWGDKGKQCCMALGYVSIYNHSF